MLTNIWVRTALCLGLAFAAGCSSASTEPEPTQQSAQFEVQEDGVLFVGASLGEGQADLAALGGDGNPVDVVEGELSAANGGSFFAMSSAKSWYESLLKEHGSIELRVYPGGMDSDHPGAGVHPQQWNSGGWGNYCQCGNCGTNYCGGCNNCAPCRCGTIVLM